MNHFDKHAAQWDKETQRIELAQQVAAAIQRRVPFHSARTALEYGCGTGLVGFVLQPLLAYLIMTDSSAGMLQMVEEKIRIQSIANVKAQKLDLSEEDPLTQTFDLIFTSMTMHHVNDVPRVLNAFHAMLNPGGYLAIADLDTEDGSFHDHAEYVHKGFDRQALQNSLIQIGFDHVVAETIFINRKMRAGEYKEYPIFLASGIKVQVRGLR